MLGDALHLEFMQKTCELQFVKLFIFVRVPLTISSNVRVYKIYFALFTPRNALRSRAHIHFECLIVAIDLPSAPLFKAAKPTI